MHTLNSAKGFALITSLLLLIVLTLLGVSAISSVSLQEQMSANLKEKERGSEAAELANRGAEQFLASYPPVGVLEEIPPASSAPVMGLGVWSIDAAIPSNDVRDFLLDSVWASNATPFQGPPFDNATLIGTGVNSVTGISEKYFQLPSTITEEASFSPYTLDPNDRAIGAGLFYYRISGRGVGGNATAVSIVQSMYLQRYR